MAPRRPLLLYLSHAGDLQRFAVGPALAAAAERAGWEFDLYYGALRRGRHFGGGDPSAAAPGWASGSLVAGGRHLDQLLWLASRYEIAALGDPLSPLWPALEAAGAEPVARSFAPAELYKAAFARLEEPVPARLLVVDGRPQGRHGVVVAPYLYPEFLAREPALGLEVSADGGTVEAVRALAASTSTGLGVDIARAEAFPGGLEPAGGPLDGDYAEVTAALAGKHADWGRGVIVGDPSLVAAQLAKARRLRLLPLYGRPQIDVLARAAPLVRRAEEPIFGRQYDDRDFFELARLGKGLQLLDPDPPFDSARADGPIAQAKPAPAGDDPDEAQLERWADEGRVLATLLLWAGMVRETDCLPRLVDLVATTDLRAGLVVTTGALEYGGSSLLPLAVPPDRGGVRGRLEPLLASLGTSVAAEALLPPGALADRLAAAVDVARGLLPDELAPRGWWPLLDAPLAPRPTWPLTVRGSRPVVRFESRGASPAVAAAPAEAPRARDVRGIVGDGVRRLGLDRFLDEWRPYERERPGRLHTGVADAVAGAGFDYMWSKTGFGLPRVIHRRGDFVALSLTAGNWDGWSPFYTVAQVRDLVRAEARLVARRRAGWLVGTIDSTLFALSGEVLEHGARLYGIAEHVAKGGTSGRLVNVAPAVIARYARLLEERGRL